MGEDLAGRHLGSGMGWSRPRSLAQVLTSCVTRARASVSPSLRLLICKMGRLGGSGSGEQRQFCRMRHAKSSVRNLQATQGEPTDAEVLGKLHTLRQAAPQDFFQVLTGGGGLGRGLVEGVAVCRQALPASLICPAHWRGLHHCKPFYFCLQEPPCKV